MCVIGRLLTSLGMLFFFLVIPSIVLFAVSATNKSFNDGLNKSGCTIVGAYIKNDTCTRRIGKLHRKYECYDILTTFSFNVNGSIYNQLVASVRDADNYQNTVQILKNNYKTGFVYGCYIDIKNKLIYWQLNTDPYDLWLAGAIVISIASGLFFIHLLIELILFDYNKTKEKTEEPIELQNK